MKIKNHLIGAARFGLLVVGAELFISCIGLNQNPDAETPVAKVELSNDSPSSKVIISWNKCNDAEGYAISRCYTRDGKTEEVHFNYISSDTTSYIDTDCEPDTEYTYIVGAGYFTGKGFFYGRVYGSTTEKYSNPVTVKTAADSRVSLKYPKNIHISTVADNTNSLKLNWDASENADYYEIYKKCLIEDSSGNYSFLMKVPANECLISHLYNEAEYCFKIKAFSNDGHSSVFSTWQSQTVPMAQNTSLNKALLIENNVTEKFYTDKEALYFLIKPEFGKIIFNSYGSVNAALLSESGNVLNGHLDFSETGNSYVCEIPDFTTETKYLLKISNSGSIEFIIK